MMQKTANAFEELMKNSSSPDLVANILARELEDLVFLVVLRMLAQNLQLKG
jgi:hypothetical protein